MSLEAASSPAVVVARRPLDVLALDGSRVSWNKGSSSVLSRSVALLRSSVVLRTLQL